MGHNDVIVCVAVINLTNEFFHRTGSISSDKSRSSGFLIMNATNIYKHTDTHTQHFKSNFQENLISRVSPFQSFLS